MVERPLRMREVGGSIPPMSTFCSRTPYLTSHRVQSTSHATHTLTLSRHAIRSHSLHSHTHDTHAITTRHANRHATHTYTYKPFTTAEPNTTWPAYNKQQYNTTTKRQTQGARRFPAISANPAHVHVSRLDSRLPHIYTFSHLTPDHRTFIHYSTHSAQGASETRDRKHSGKTSVRRHSIYTHMRTHTVAPASHTRKLHTRVDIHVIAPTSRIHYRVLRPAIFSPLHFSNVQASVLTLDS